MIVKCQHCGYEWDYRGNLRVKASCPDCGKKTPINGGTENGKNPG